MKGNAFFQQMASSTPLSRLHPQVASFFQEFLAAEKVVEFGDQLVLNTHFPPYPSSAFDQLLSHFDRVDESPLHSVTFAVTNRCPYSCWHCYNADRCQRDIPLDGMREVAAQLQEQGAIMVALSGGEPMLRDDLEEIAAAFDDHTCLTLNTTGFGFTPKRAAALRKNGLFAVGVSLDSIDPEEHDRMRGHSGAFHIALDALQTAEVNGLYPYVVAVATREFLDPERFWKFIDFIGETPAREIHLLEPCPTGRLAGQEEIALDSRERQLILRYQLQVSQREDLPILSSFAHMESPDAFGCGAGLTHLYIDGSGEVSPCNLVPLSFGNVAQDPLEEILGRMRCSFCKPRTVCVGRVLAPHIPDEQLPTPPAVSRRLCEQHLPTDHPVPRFFQIRTQAQEEVGQPELQSAYDRVHGDYDEFWVTEAGKPVEELLEKLDLADRKRILEAGCGTGHATVRIAPLLPEDGEFTAVDLSPGMLGEARRKTGDNPGIRFIAGDALEELKNADDLDLVFSSWVLGYIPLNPFFTAVEEALSPGGQLAFVVHKENSPREPLEIFSELVARDPSVLLKRVDFDFPPDMDHVRTEIGLAGLDVEQLWEGAITFTYDSPEQVLEHLLKSGAGTAFNDAIDPARRDRLQQQFLEILSHRQKPGEPCRVIHDYITCIATKP